MNVALWIAQILLAVLFLMSGFMKATQPREKLAKNMDWVNDFSPTAVKAIGVLEMLGAIGLVLPALLNVMTILTPLAAGGLALVMVGAVITHLRRKEYPVIVANLVLMALAVFVLYGRLVLVPFQA